MSKITINSINIICQSKFWKHYNNNYKQYSKAKQHSQKATSDLLPNKIDYSQNFFLVRNGYIIRHVSEALYIVDQSFPGWLQGNYQNLSTPMAVI